MKKIRIITRVEDVTRHELIYIYHHLQIGNNVDLIKVDENPSKYEVYFKGFCLGYIIIPSWLKSLSGNQKSLKAIVNCMSKSKFLPTKGLDLEITV